ncbi:TetR/AcrR family transcriptional regulator [Superficieibacter sp.]|uniref:TetR/AcrR family transcriptional regulator n=1 Tax=Superficieibacter sp. TaxID=2303322 RepID=UPI0028ACB0CE|nr:TetR/AcrR family transcriptional regulator [Superficieibacter sp.]
MGRHKQFDEAEALEAALAVFWQKGYEGTSFPDLTQATGVARPGLYAAFGNKEALFQKALDLYQMKYLDFMAAALTEPTSRKVAETILRGCARLHTMSAVHPGCLGINGALACSDDAESIRGELIRRRAEGQRALKARFEQAKREGDLPASADSAVLASVVMTTTQGMAVQAKAGALREDLEGVAEYVLGTWPTKE